MLNASPHRTAGRRALAALALLVVPAIASAQDGAKSPAATAATDTYVGRPIYSEPGSGLQLPPGCQLEPSWRGRMANSDLELWVVSCGGETRTWVLRRSTIEMISANQARLRFLVMDERRWPGETAGDTVSVQCVGRNGGADSGFVVIGAKWRAVGPELRLTGATSVLRVDPGLQKFVAAGVSQVDCARHPEREAMMRRLQQR